MTGTIALGIASALFVLFVLFELLRRDKLREKYAVIWFLVALAVMSVAIYPPLLNGAAKLVGVQIPANLLFFLASMVLFGLTLHHSHELGRLEEKTRTLAEELALLRLDLESPDLEGRDREHRDESDPPHT